MGYRIRDQLIGKNSHHDPRGDRHCRRARSANELSIYEQGLDILLFVRFDQSRRDSYIESVFF